MSALLESVALRSHMPAVMRGRVSFPGLVRQRDRPDRSSMIRARARDRRLSGFRSSTAARSCWRATHTGRPAHHIALAGLIRTFQTVLVYERICLLDNLASPPAVRSGDLCRRVSAAPGASAMRSTPRKPAPARVDRIVLPALLRGQVVILSTAKKLVALAAALILIQDVVLDEPVLRNPRPPAPRDEVALSELNRAGRELLIGEHNVEFSSNFVMRPRAHPGHEARRRPAAEIPPIRGA